MVLSRSINWHRRGNKQDIAILCSPRSGSTWLMEALSTQSRLGFLNEPLYKPYIEFNKVLPKSQLVYVNLSADEQTLLKHYLTQSQAIKHCGPRSIFDKGYSLITTRRVHKIINATPLIDWFVDELGFAVVHLIRHPLAQCLSSLKHRIPYRIAPFINTHSFMNDVLTKEQRTLTERIYKNGSDHEKYVTGWCLENIVPLRRAESPSCIRITYEELVSSPTESFEFLAEKLNLDDITKLTSRLKVPSRTATSTSPDRLKGIRDRDSDYLLKEWGQRIEKSEASALFKILSVFNIDIYKDNDPFPSEPYLHFPDLIGK